MLYVSTPVPKYDRLVVFASATQAMDAVRGQYLLCDQESGDVTFGDLANPPDYEQVEAVSTSSCSTPFKALKTVNASPALLDLDEAVLRGGMAYPCTTDLLRRYAAEGGLVLTGVLPGVMYANDDDSTKITVGSHPHWERPVLRLSSSVRASAFTAVFGVLAGRHLTPAEEAEANEAMHTDGMQAEPAWKGAASRPRRSLPGEIDYTGLFDDE